MSDLIDRQAAIDAIRASTSKYTGFMEMEMYTDDDAVEAIEAVPAASPWHRVEEPPIEYQRCMVYSSETRQMVSGVWTAEYGWMIPGPIGKLTHWMPIEPPKEDV